MTYPTYAELRKDKAFLTALEAAGVDNWDGYGYAQEMHAELLSAMDEGPLVLDEEETALVITSLLQLVSALDLAENLVLEGEAKRHVSVAWGVLKDVLGKDTCMKAAHVLTRVHLEDDSE